MKKKNLKESQEKIYTCATGAEGNSSSIIVEITQARNLRVLNDRVLVFPDKEVQIEATTPQVLIALQEKTIVLPEQYESYYLKRPQWGVIVGFGEKCKHAWKIGQEVAFARDGWAKLIYKKTEYFIFKEDDIHATLDSLG